MTQRKHRIAFVLPAAPDFEFFSGFTSDPRELKPVAEALTKASAAWALETHDLNSGLLSKTHGEKLVAWEQLRG